jgi:hypothetical protein
LKTDEPKEITMKGIAIAATVALVALLTPASAAPAPAAPGLQLSETSSAAARLPEPST